MQLFAEISIYRKTELAKSIELPKNQGLLLRNKVLPKSKINIFTTPQNPQTNFLKMPDFKAKICTFSLCFMGFLM